MATFYGHTFYGYTSYGYTYYGAWPRVEVLRCAGPLDLDDPEDLEGALVVGHDDPHRLPEGTCGSSAVMESEAMARADGEEVEEVEEVEEDGLRSLRSLRSLRRRRTRGTGGSRSAPAAAPRATALAACLTISSGDCGTRGSRVVAASDTIFGDCETRLETGGRRVVAQSASAAGQSPTSIPRAEHRISAPTQRGEGVLRNNGRKEFSLVRSSTETLGVCRR